MALIICKDCKKEFSTDAKRCPHCGAKKPSKFLKNFFIIFIIISILSVIGGKEDKKKTNEDYAILACREFAKKITHDPSSFEFNKNEAISAFSGNNKYTVIAPVRAKNGFGSLRLFKVKCELSKENENWNIIKIEEI